MFFKYRNYLEQQVREHKERIRELEGRNDRLVEALVPILRKMNEPKVTQKIEVPSTPHKMRQDGHTADCTCGWHIFCADPASLQEQVSNHYRENAPKPARGGRISWSQAKAKLEAEAVLENNKEEAS